MILSQFDQILLSCTCFLWHFIPIPLRKIVSLNLYALYAPTKIICENFHIPFFRPYLPKFQFSRSNGLGGMIF